MLSARLSAAVVARLKRVRKIVWRPVVRAARPKLKTAGKWSADAWRQVYRRYGRTSKQVDALYEPGVRAVRDAGRSAIANAGWTLLPPWRCPACGSFRKRRRLALCSGVIAAPYHRRLVFATGCPSCGLLYASPSPAASRHDELYSEEGEWAAGHQQATDAVASERLSAAMDAVTGFRMPQPGAAVLDFGCGHGRWLNTFQQYGWTTFGIDPALKSAFPRHTELHTIPDDARFDFVVLSHVLEHVPNPGDVVQAMGRATRPGGWMYVGVPGLDALPSHRDWKYVLNANTHIAAYSLACLTELLGRAGFGAPSVLTLADTKAAIRLRLVAQKTGTPVKVPRPLDAAIAALRGGGVLR